MLLLVIQRNKYNEDSFDQREGDEDGASSDDVDVIEVEGRELEIFAAGGDDLTDLTDANTNNFLFV